jgi:AraC-like DNA-binding protein
LHAPPPFSQAILHIAHLDIKSEVSKFIEQLHGIIEENLSNPLFTVEDLGKKLVMSRASMYRKIHYLSGLSPQLYIRSYRLKRAAQLLENNYGNVTEVCFRVGFTSTAYFAKCFKGEFQQSPKTFASCFANHLSPVSTVTMPGSL